LTFKGKLGETCRRVERWRNGGYAPRGGGEEGEGGVGEGAEMREMPRAAAQCSIAEVNGTAIGGSAHEIV
jgi:hypothetical protein